MEPINQGSKRKRSASIGETTKPAVDKKSNGVLPLSRVKVSKLVCIFCCCGIQPLNLSEDCQVGVEQCNRVCRFSKAYSVVCREFFDW